MSTLSVKTTNTWNDSKTFNWVCGTPDLNKSLWLLPFVLTESGKAMCDHYKVDCSAANHFPKQQYYHTSLLEQHRSKKERLLQGPDQLIQHTALLFKNERNKFLRSIKHEKKSMRCRFGKTAKFALDKLCGQGMGYLTFSLSNESY